MIKQLLFAVGIAGVVCSCRSVEEKKIDYSVKFEDVTKQMNFKTRGRCAAWADLDGDGWTDLVADGRIWKNCSGRKFENVTKQAGIRKIHGPCVITDFNGDGINDIYFISAGGWLYLGEGNFKFKQGKAFKNPSRSIQAAAAADLDGDGYPDVYIANYEIWSKQLEYPDVILKNNKGELVKQWIGGKKDIWRARGATCCDFNNDGNIDIYVSHYRLIPNYLWVNHGKWKLVNEAREFGCAGTERKNVVFKASHKRSYRSSGHTIGSLWADFDNDTYFDLFVGNFSHPPKYQDRPMFLKNGGPKKDYHFIDKSKLASIPWQESYSSPTAADVDNDGNVDLFYATIYPRDNSRMFRNLGGWRFGDVTKTSGIKSDRTYQAAFADFDNDGRVDLITDGKLFRNVSTAGNWLRIKLTGRAPNTTAPGAKVFVTCGDRVFSRQVEAGTGNGNQNDLLLHFGLGGFCGEADVKIIWPDGKEQHLASLPNKLLEVKQQ